MKRDKDLHSELPNPPYLSKKGGTHAESEDDPEVDT